ncbi:MAG: DNA translocase FtsK 4TM domain-containing protein [Patescibacteria group bacterium]
MSKQNKSQKSKLGRPVGRPPKEQKSSRKLVSPDIKKSILAVLILATAAIFLLSLFAVAGSLGTYVDLVLKTIFGGSAWILPFALIGFALILFFNEEDNLQGIHYFGFGIFVLGYTGIFQNILWQLGKFSEIKAESGGYLGYYIAQPLNQLMGPWATLILLLALTVIGALMASEISIQRILQALKNMITSTRDKSQVEEQYFSSEDFDEGQIDFDQDEIKNAEEGSEDKKPKAVFSRIAKKEDKMEVLTSSGSSKRITIPIDLLEKMNEKAASSGNIEHNKEMIRRTLANFNIPVEMSDVSVGPTVTQYALRPAQGVKLSQITTLNNDLALAMAAHPIRIEAPIPGKSLVGIEIPNKIIATVSLREVLESDTFKERKSSLMIPFGKDVAGKVYMADLAKMPHLLVAGATGSGKTVCLNTIIVSLLYQNSFQDLKMIMVDPKRVEMSGYEGIPHLLTPVITDVKKTVNALKWAVSEMENRFDMLSKVGKREIESYNKIAEDKLPYIVIVIDELADLMATSANDVEGCIVRLAQMARAVGIHLIMATQRPSVNVITGLIKANIPARAAFSVASSIDSRTILDSSGAEKLLGRGDMLFVSASLSSPVRIQGAWVSDDSIHAVVEYLREQAQPEYVDSVTEKITSGSVSYGGISDEEDDLLPEAREIIWRAGKASASLLQRRLRIGYARAARILDLLQEQGIIGPTEGAKPREVLVTQAEFFGQAETNEDENDEDSEPEENEINEFESDELAKLENDDDAEEKF